LRQTIATIKESKPGLTSDEGIAKVSKLLPRDSLCRVYISPSGLLGFVKQIVTTAMPQGAGANLHIPELGATPPVAVGVRGGENEIESQMLVPPELLEEIGRLASGGASAGK